MRRIALVLLLAGCSQELKGFHKDGADVLELQQDSYGCMKDATFFGGATIVGSSVKATPSGDIYLACMQARGYQPVFY